MKKSIVKITNEKMNHISKEDCSIENIDMKLNFDTETILKVLPLVVDDIMGAFNIKTFEIYYNEE